MKLINGQNFQSNFEKKKEFDYSSASLFSKFAHNSVTVTENCLENDEIICQHITAPKNIFQFEDSAFLNTKTFILIPKSMKSNIRLHFFTASQEYAARHFNAPNIFNKIDQIHLDIFDNLNASISTTKDLNASCQLQNLLVVDLKKCNLQALPDQLFNLVMLKSLLVDDNELSTIPLKINKLQHLEVFTCSKNFIKEFPMFSENILRKLEKLDFSYNCLVKLPNQIEKFECIKYFNISYNFYHELPSVIHLMKNLQVFICEWFSYCIIGSSEIIESSNPNFLKLLELSKNLQTMHASLTFRLIFEYFNFDNPINNFEEKKYEILQQSAIFGSIGVMRSILPLDTKILNKIDSNNKTPLISALQKYNIPAAKYLLALGADPNIGSTEQGNCLNIAAQILDVDLICKIIACGADTNLSNSFGTAPLHFIMAFFDDDVKKSSIAADLLLRNNADPNLRNNDTITPLIGSVMLGQINAIRFIKEYNFKKSSSEIQFNFNKKIKETKETIFHIAIKKKDSEILSEIEEYINNPFYENKGGHAAVSIGKIQKSSKKNSYSFSTHIKIGYKIEKKFVYQSVLNRFSATNKLFANLGSSLKEGMRINSSKCVIKSFLKPVNKICYPVLANYIAEEYDDYENRYSCDIGSEFYADGDTPQDMSEERSYTDNKYFKKPLSLSYVKKTKTITNFISSKTEVENNYEKGLNAYQSNNYEKFRQVVEEMYDFVADEKVINHLRIILFNQFLLLANKIFAHICKIYRLKSENIKSFSFLLQSPNFNDSSVDILKLISHYLEKFWDLLTQKKINYISHLLCTEYIKRLRSEKLDGLLPFKEIKSADRLYLADLICLKQNNMLNQNNKPDFHSVCRKLESPIGPRVADTFFGDQENLNFRCERICEKVNRNLNIEASKSLFTKKSVVRPLNKEDNENCPQQLNFENKCLSQFQLQGYPQNKKTAKSMFQNFFLSHSSSQTKNNFASNILS